jgi:hypothetical protein
MKPLDRTLLTKLTVVVLLKLGVLTALYWAFVRPQRVQVDANRASAQLLSPSAGSATGVKP